MILSFSGKMPQTAPAAFIAPNATLLGGVALKACSSVWYGAVLRADTGKITVGAGSNIQDNAVLHTGPALDITLGENVTVGHSAVVHGCTVDDNVLIGMHATLMNGCRIGKNCIIGAGALVPQGMEIPQGSIVLGVPARIHGTATPEQIAANTENAAHYRALAQAHAEACRLAERGLHVRQL